MKPRKRLFLGLQTGGLLLLLTAAGVFAYLFLTDSQWLGNLFLVLLLSALAAVLIFMAAGIGGLVLGMIRGRPLPLLEMPTRVAIEFFFPLTIWLGRLLRVSKERIEHSFIEVNNQLTRAREVKVPPEELIILAPHCLQRADCRYKITMNVENCRRCGECKIDQLLDYRDRYGVEVQVVTGGTLARKVLQERRPQAVVAIACERDLVAGLQDVYPLPARGIVNIRPHGPCINTDVSLNAVDEAVMNFIRD